MQLFFFTFLAALVAMGVQRMSRDGAGAKKAFTRKGREKEALPVQDMTQCPTCKAYVIKDAKGCPTCTEPPSSAA